MLKKIYNQENIKLWLSIFCALNFTFLYYQVTFFWGNHDWDWIKGTTQVLSLNTGMFEGRYAKFILNVILFGGQIFPFLNNLIAFALLAAGGVLLVNYWQIKNAYVRFFIALIPILAPYILGWLYFPINILGNFLAIDLVLSGLILIKNNNLKHNIAATLCFLLALGVYPSVAEMMIICFCFYNILEPKKKIKPIFKSAIFLVLSLVIFKLLLFILGKYNLIYADYYNLKTVSFNELIARTPAVIKLVLGQFITTIPFISIRLKLIGIIIVALSLIKLRGSQMLFWVIALTTTGLSTWLTAVPEETAYMPRVNFYGLNFFLAGSAAVLLSNKGWRKNLGYLLCLFYICNSITLDVYAQKVWNLGKISEEQLVKRISSRIREEKSESIIPIIAGELSLRPRYYVEEYQKESPYLLNKPFMVRHIPAGMFNFYEDEQIFYSFSRIADMSPDLYKYLKTAQKIWPAEQSLYIDDKYAIIILTNEGLASIQSQLPY